MMMRPFAYCCRYSGSLYPRYSRLPEISAAPARARPHVPNSLFSKHQATPPTLCQINHFQFLSYYMYVLYNLLPQHVLHELVRENIEYVLSDQLIFHFGNKSFPAVELMAALALPTQPVPMLRPTNWGENNVMTNRLRGKQCCDQPKYHKGFRGQWHDILLTLGIVFAWVKITLVSHADCHIVQRERMRRRINNRCHPTDLSLYFKSFSQLI